MRERRGSAIECALQGDVFLIRNSFKFVIRRTVFQLENKYFLYTLGLIPVFIIIFWLMNRWRKKALRSFGDVAIIQQLIPDVSQSKRIWKFILFTIAFAFVIIGIVNPQVGT